MFDAILINYNCMHRIAHLARQLDLEPLIARIIIINNSRSDLADWDAFELSAKMLCVSSLQNTGYAGGNQLGFDVLKGLSSENHLCVLNADVEFPRDVFDVGLDVFSMDESIAQVSFRTRDGKGRFLYDAMKLCGLMHEGLPEQTQNVIPTDYAPGSFFLLRSGAVADLDCLFFEPFFLYWEEVDLSFRLREAGWKTVCCTERTITRYANPLRASVGSVYFIVRNAFLFVRRNRIQHPRWIRFLFRNMMQSIRLALSSRSTAPLFLFFRGLLDGVRGRYGPR